MNTALSIYRSPALHPAGGEAGAGLEGGHAEEDAELHGADAEVLHERTREAVEVKLISSKNYELSTKLDL